MIPIYGITIRRYKQVISKCSTVQADRDIADQLSEQELRKMNSLLLLSFLWSAVSADIYLHNPRYVSFTVSSFEE